MKLSPVTICRGNHTAETVQGYVLSADVAVTPVPGGKKWTITHIASGLMIASLLPGSHCGLKGETLAFGQALAEIEHGFWAIMAKVPFGGSLPKDAATRLACSDFRDQCRKAVERVTRHREIEEIGRKVDKRHGADVGAQYRRDATAHYQAVYGA